MEHGSDRDVLSRRFPVQFLYASGEKAIPKRYPMVYDTMQICRFYGHNTFRQECG